MSDQIIKLSDCTAGLPIQIVSSGEILIVTDVKEADLICKNLTTLLTQNHPLSLVNRSGNMIKASETVIREQAGIEISVIRGTIKELRTKIEELQAQAQEKLLLIKAVRDYSKK